MAQENQEERPNGRTPLLEWISAAIGLVITLAMLGFIGWQAWTGSGAEPPAVEVHVLRVVPASGGWVVEFAAENLSPATAAAVQIEGELKDGERVVATSEATIDYVPGRSVHQGGLFFEQDPAEYSLGLRALGYAEP